MKEIRTVQELITEARAGDPLAIYGAGWAGKIIGKLLKANGIPVTAFAVTAQEREWEQEGIPVCCLDDILGRCCQADLCIILAVTRSNRQVMEEELKKRKIDSYLEVSDALLYEAVRETRRIDAGEAERHKGVKEFRKTVGYLVPGYLDTNYAEQRLVIDRIEGVSYVAMPKETADIALTGIRSGEDWERCRQLTEACYWPDVYVPEVDFIHIFNAVCKTDRPWCASFETVLPRVWPNTEAEEAYFLQLVECMKQPNCKALYAFCKNAYEIQKHYLGQHLTAGDVDLLMKKTKVLHPPQKVLVTKGEFEKKHDKKNIHFIFVGNGFFFKGGREVIKALSRFEKQFNFTLTIVSGMMHNDYFTKASYEEVIKWKKVIREKKWIDYYASLPNEKVLEKCREATVGVLPSVAETYGYAVLEMQAAGCPVVTTDIRAFPEINHEECGWICRIPKDEFGHCSERNEIVWSGILEKELERNFREIFEHPEEIKKRGQAALERIQNMHDPHKYQNELRRNLL